MSRKLKQSLSAQLSEKLQFLRERLHLKLSSAIKITSFSLSFKGPYFYRHEKCHFTWQCHLSVILSYEITVSGEITLFVTVEKWTIILQTSVLVHSTKDS